MITKHANPLRYKITDSLPTGDFINSFSGRDTVIFSQSSYRGLKVLAFNDKNVLNITSKGINLIAKEESDDTYTLLVKMKGKLILSKKHIKGISKVLLDDKANNYMSKSKDIGVDVAVTRNCFMIVGHIDKFGVTVYDEQKK